MATPNSNPPTRAVPQSKGRLLVKFTLLFLIVSLSGCVTTEPASLDAMQNRQVRLLASDCYNSILVEAFRRGRRIYGDDEVWEACVAQAKQKVRPHG